eukprot:scaffold14000_cov135-Isochrysis_galbana.AAC.12
MSISAYASDLSAASPSHSCDITQSHPSTSSGMVQPVVNEMFATVHAAGSSLLGLFTSCATFNSTPEIQWGPSFLVTRTTREAQAELDLRIMPFFSMVATSLSTTFSPSIPSREGACRCGTAPGLSGSSTSTKCV